MRRNDANKTTLALFTLITLAAVVIAAAGCASLPPLHAPEKGGTAATNGTLSAHFLNVGRGDATLFVYGNRTMLVDGGPTEAGPTVAAYLKGQGIDTLDVVVSTHPHEDHIGGLLTVLRDFPVRMIYDSGQPHTTRTYEKYLTLIDRKNIPYRVPQRGDTIDLGPGVTVEVLSPPPGGIRDGDLNDNSIVLRITHGDVSFLLEADAGFRAESAMLASGCDLGSEVLKVAHHGSKYSSGARFLKAVDPKYAVIEVGNGEKYGHPAPATLARLAAIGATVYRTDRDGNIVMASDGRGIIVATQRGAPG